VFKNTINLSPRNVAMDYLSRREHSRAELEQKLTAKDFDLTEIKGALDRLVIENLQSDARFAQSYIHYRISKGVGPIKIRHELKQKGVIESVVHQAEQEEECDWAYLLNKVAYRKYSDFPAKDIKQKLKQTRFLQQRGFAMHDIMRLFAQ